MDDETRIADLLEKLEYLAPPQREYVAMLIRLAFVRGQQTGIQWFKSETGRAH